MVTRLASRHRSTIRNPYGPSSGGFPSVKSKMLREEEVRGDMFIDTKKFNYSHYMASENYNPSKPPSHNLSVCGGTKAGSAAHEGAGTTRSHSIDAT
mmetsp:Transcript_35707/g.43708  ORF Transcript_35707/g.43708 Transcript_35707/m.43708 type:complete len:97 (+) Transcript_35707:1130-1420(+)